MADRPPFEQLSWWQAKQTVQDGRLDLLGRSTEWQAKYRIFQAELTERWASVSDYVLVTKLGYEEKGFTNADGKRCAVRPDSVATKTVLVENDFPYNFDDGVYHHVLWKVGGEGVNDADIADSIQHLRTTQGAVDTAYYVNPPHLKSILDIDHAHILFVKELPPQGPN
jgi:hypothetical protein